MNSNSNFNKIREIPLHTPLNYKTLSKDEQMQYLCALGHLAPSTHNTQPWRFAIQDNQITIYVYRPHVLPASDVIGRQAIISVGCAMENIIISARYLGLKPTITLSKNIPKMIQSTTKDETGKSIIELLTIQFTTSEPELSLEPLFKSIPKRQVTRAEYDPARSIPPEVVSNLEALMKDGSTKLHLITDSLRRLSIAEFQAQADGYVINSPIFSQELGQWLLPNDTLSFVGMPGIGFGLNDAEAQRLY